jgi:PAS domain S-box-containing protein
MAQSLSRRISISLTLAVLIVSTLAITAINTIVSRTALQNLERKADETIKHAAGILEVPLWEVSSRYITEIGQIVSQDEAIAKIVIYNDSGAAVSSLSKEKRGELITRSSKIFHKHEDRSVYVGTVEIALAKDVYKAQNRQLLFSSIFIIIVILVSIVVATGFLIRTYLRKPLDSLNNIVRLYASGTYTVPSNSIPFVEFQPFGTVLADMADKITAQIKKVQEAETKYRTIYDNAAEGIFQTTPEGRYISANPSMASILGYENPTILTDSFSDIGKEIYQDASRREELIRQLSTNDTVSDFEFKLRRKNGEIIWATLNARTVRDVENKLLYLEGFLSDINKRKQAEEALLEAQEELIRKEKLAILGQLSGSVGHELRNPLGVMSNAIYFLKMVLTDADDTVGEYLDIIKKEIDNSLRIITDLLDFARTKAPQIKAVAARALIDESLGRCAIPENIDLQTEISEHLPLLKVDQLQMGQVLQNLIMNAVQAMPAGGTLTIQGGQDSEGTVWLKVADTGEGISPENRKKLFHPLFTTKARGIGLGLVVCRNLTEANGGRIEVESEPGTGTVFTVRLPIEGLERPLK